MMRESSPPDAIRASGRRSSPGFGDSMNSAVSRPFSVQAELDELSTGMASGRKTTSNRVFSMARWPSSARTFFCEVEGAGPPLPRELPRPLEVPAGEGLPLGLEGALLLLGGSHLLELGPAPGTVCHHLRGRRSVLLLEPLDRGQARFQLVEAAWGDLDPLAVVPEEERQVLELGEHGAPALQVGQEVGVHRPQFLDLAEDLTEVPQSGAVVFVEESVGLGGEAGQPARVRLSGFLVPERLFLVGAQVRPLDLVRLEGQHLPPALRLTAVLAQTVQAPLDLAEPGVEAREVGGVQAGVAVEEIHVGSRVEQALRIVLPVNRRHERRELLQERERDERPVDRGAALARGLDLAPDHDLVRFHRQAVILQESFEG